MPKKRTRRDWSDILFHAYDEVSCTPLVETHHTVYDVYVISTCEIVYVESLFVR